MKDLISVIVPIYNVEKYISKCLNSIINQTYKNLEILLVDDGSLDNCLQICNKFRKKDERIQVIHKKNGGVSSARNIGIDKSHGEYILFVDPDDWLESNMIEILYDSIKTNECDIVACDYYINYEDNEVKHNQLREDMIISNQDEMYKYLFDEKYYAGYLWNKLIRKDLIDKLNLKFDENVRVCEDLLFLSKLMSVCEKIIYIPKYKLYHYRQTMGSAINFTYSRKDLTKLVPLKYFIDNGIIYGNVIYEYFILNCQGIYILRKERNADDLEIINMKKESKKYIKHVLKNTNTKQKIKAILWYLFPMICGKIKDKNFKG